jgi:hypothetical protein
VSLICPRCAVPMVEVVGYDGLHVCTADPGHVFDEDGVPPEPPKPMGYNHLMGRAAPFWLSHLGIDQPIDRVAQSNYGDGRMMMGPAAPGGGSKSKRKKPKLKAKAGPLAPYEER